MSRIVRPLVSLTAATVLLAAAPAAASARRWVGTWTASPSPPYTTGISATGFTNQTVREIVHTSVGGRILRLRLANTFGGGPLTVDDVGIARSAGGAAIAPAFDRSVTFGGDESVTIPRGARVLSDPVRLRVRPDSDMAVSLYLSGATGPTTWHQLGVQTNYISTAGTTSTTPRPPRSRPRRPRTSSSTASTSPDRGRSAPSSRSATRSPTATTRR